MSNQFREDLATAIDRLRDTGVITAQTVAEWSRLLANGFVDFVRTRGNNMLLGLVLGLSIGYENSFSSNEPIECS